MEEQPFDGSNESEYCDINLTGFHLDTASHFDVSYILCGPLLTSVVILGLFGNFLCLLTFAGTRSRPLIYLYLIALSVWDTCLLICSYLLYSLPVLLYGGVYAFGPYVPVYPIFYTLTNVTHSGSVWTMVVLAVERYFALCRPLKYITWDIEIRVKTLLLSVAAGSVLYHVPNFFEISVDDCCVLTTTGRVTLPCLSSSPLREHHLYKLLYKTVGGFVFFSVGPLAVLLLLTCSVWLEVRRNMKLQRKMSRNDGRRSRRRSATHDHRTASEKVRRHSESRQFREDNKTDIMLVAVMIKFCVCQTLPTFLDMYETLFQHERFRPTFEILVDISNVLVVCNSSCNFLIYFALGAKFREALSNLCRRKQRLLRQKTIAMTLTSVTVPRISEVHASEMTPLFSEGHRPSQV